MGRSVKKKVSLCLTACLIINCQLAIAGSLQPQGLDYAGIYALQQADPNLTGAGVRVAVICRSITYIDGEPQNDYRPNTQHNCFADKQFDFHDQNELPAGISPHSTAICSILFGSDPNAFGHQLGQFRYQGIVPQAQADIYEFWYFLTNNVFTNSPLDADVLTASIGSQFEDWWTRGIESLAANYGLVIVAGIGNGSDAFDPPLYPGAGANVIGVGVVDSVDSNHPAISLANFSLAYPEHSSFGPTADQRCKPDIVAIGNCLTADANDPNRYEPAGNWSSFSTPMVAGTLGLLIQKAKHDPSLADAVSPDSGNCVMKAILLNSATKLPYWHKGKLQKDDDHTAPLDYVQGAGMLNAIGAYEHLTAGQSGPNEVSATGWDLNQLEESQTSSNVYRMTVTEPANKFITATVAWNRHYSRTYPFEPNLAKDGNLRLELWAVDLNNQDNDYLLDYSDSNNDNLEHIYCQADPNYDNYQIVVSYSTPTDPSQTDTVQRYGLAWNVSVKQQKNSILWYDLNADGIVNDSDLTVMLNNLLTGMEQPETYLLGDINTDGTIDISDMNILLDHKGAEADWYKENKPK